jgi:GNAT superfamily N-acetyltransferase
MWLAMQSEQAAKDDRYKLSEDAGDRWLNDLREWIDARRVRRVTIVETGGEVVGFATSLLTWPPPIYEQEEEVFVEDVYVRPTHRGRGAGAALFEDARAWAEEQSIETIRLRALSRNSEAVDFWKGLGLDEFVTEFVFHRSSD